MIRLIRIFWVAPNTTLGIAVGILGLATGGRVQFRRGCLEFWGGWTRLFLVWMPGGSRILAMTLGHSILGQSAAALEVSRDHEHVHVRQYERWGPAFVPAYLAASVWMWIRGRDPYRDNPFEKEAWGEDEQRRLAKRVGRESDDGDG